MRLQLTLVFLVALAGTARAQTTFGSQIQVYADSDHTTVVSPVVSATADVASNTTVSAGYVADVVTSASIDIVSQASPTTIHDTRHQVSLALSHAFDKITAHGGYVFSTENDYRSHVLSGGLDLDLDEKNTTLSVSYALSLNTVERSGDSNFQRSLTVHDVSLAWTQVLSRKAVAQLTYELNDSEGFQASPYRFVPIEANVGDMPEYWVPETDPETRWRHALVGGINYSLGGNTSVQGDYRLYHDTWGITSHTIGTRLFFDLSKKVSLRLRNRFYTQNGATFYQDHYPAPAQYMALDRELSPLWSETLGGKLTIGIGERLEAELKLDGFYYHYNDFPLLHSRLGVNAGVGLSLEYQ